MCIVKRTTLKKKKKPDPRKLSVVMLRFLSLRIGMRRRTRRFFVIIFFFSRFSNKDFRDPRRRRASGFQRKNGKKKEENQNRHLQLPRGFSLNTAIQGSGTHCIFPPPPPGENFRIKHTTPCSILCTFNLYWRTIRRHKT